MFFRGAVLATSLSTLATAPLAQDIQDMLGVADALNQQLQAPFEFMQKSFEASPYGRPQRATQNIPELIEMQRAARDQCYGNPTSGGCERSIQIANYLSSVYNVCYGRESQPTVEYEYHTCTYDSYR